MVICLCAAKVDAAQPASPEPIPGIGPSGPITRLHSDFKFTEGPAADAQGNLYFTDVPAGLILKSDAMGKLTTFLEDSRGCNGLMVDGQGRLLACQGGEGRVIAIDVATKEVAPRADKHNGKRFIQPNDLVVDRGGGVYFTDPVIGRGDRPQDRQAVYYAAPDGTATRLIDDLLYPNGVILSPDEKTLYVVPSGSVDVMAYAIEAPGKIGPGRVLAALQQTTATFPKGGDGLTIDTKGNLYVTVPAASSIQVITYEGKTLGMIPIPEQPSNCTFGGPDRKTLFVTARKSVYSMPMEATGHSVAAK